MGGGGADHDFGEARVDQVHNEFAAAPRIAGAVFRGAVVAVAGGENDQRRVVAEGVETQPQLDALVALGCDEIQGWVYCKAMPAAALRDWVTGFRAGRAANGPAKPESGPEIH